MLAHEVLRAAADLIEAQGWSQGAPARDRDGVEVPLYQRAAGETSRTSVNPAAWQFSAYGAIAKVLASRPGISVNGSMWTELAAMARQRGSRGHTHPLVGYNDAEDRTVAEVVALLRDAADAMDPAKRALEAGRAT